MSNEKKPLKIAVVPGDGIGIEVVREAVKVLSSLDDPERTLSLVEYPFGAEHYLSTGETLPDSALEEFRQADAILMGAFGDPRIPDMVHARDILLGTRVRLDLFANIRPVRCFSDRLNPLKYVRTEDIDFVVFRENTEGAYAGAGGVLRKGSRHEVAIQEDINTRFGVERIIRLAFDYASRHGRSRVTMSDKSNALRFGHDLWQRVFMEVAADYPDIETDHLYVDVLAMEMVRNPARLDVIVTCNMFGDIVSDVGAALQGGLGLAGSANIHPGGPMMFEPVHGSAPDIAGKEIANPFAAILCGGSMLQHLGCLEDAARVESAVRECLSRNECTEDLGGNLGTRAAGDAVVAAL